MKRKKIQRIKKITFFKFIPVGTSASMFRPVEWKAIIWTGCHPSGLKSRTPWSSWHWKPTMRVSKRTELTEEAFRGQQTY